MTTVGDVMSRNLLTVEPATELRQAAERALARAPQIAVSRAEEAETGAEARLARDASHPEAWLTTTPGYSSGLPVAVAGRAPAVAGVEIRQSLYDPARLAVYGLRLIQDYLLGPRVLGGSVGIAPLAVLICVFAVGLLFGAAYVPLSTPFLAVVATVVDVLVRGARPTEQEVPSVVFSSSSLEEYRAETRTRTGS